MLNRRTNILLDENRYNKVVSEARKKGISIGELIRQAIDDKIDNKDEEIIKQRTEAVNKIYELQKKMKPFKRIDYRKLIDYGRYR